MNGLFILLLTCLNVISFPVYEQPATQTVLVKNLDKKKGEVYIGWYNSEQDYMVENRAFIKKIVAVRDKQEIAVKFEQVTPGTYAIAVFLMKMGMVNWIRTSWVYPKKNMGFPIILRLLPAQQPLKRLALP